MYYDKHGRLIKAGMVLVSDDDEKWEVCETISAFGDKDLGLSCNAGEAYPLWQFDLSEWSILDDDY